jgi:serine/threonine protein kinase
MLGQTISHYRVISEIGAGGMGVVYKAEDLRLGRFVALKFLPTELMRDPSAKQRFIQEARAASSLEHANICTIHDIEETTDGRMFLSMAFCEGETLKQRLERGALPRPRRHAWHCRSRGASPGRTSTESFTGT